MFTNGGQFKLGGNGQRLRAPAPGLLGRLLTAVASAAVLAVTFMFSLVIFSAVAAIALLGGIYLWWKTRALRRQLRERPPGGRVIEGEVIQEAQSPH